MNHDKITDYINLLLKWNKAYNLTAITQPADIQTKHINDSLSVLPYLKGQRIIDVGTGAGFPGIPLAIAAPEKQFVLLDSNGKKIRFLKQVVHELALQNVEVINTRVELLNPDELFDTVITRAFASLLDMINTTQHLLKSGGYFLAMKGIVPVDDLKKLPHNISHIETHQISVPGLNEARCLVILCKD